MTKKRWDQYLQHQAADYDEEDAVVVIPKENLIKGRYYYGEGRFDQPIALWDGENFRGYATECGFLIENYAAYGERGFDPIRILEV